MTSENASHATHDPRLDRILAEYLEAVESGTIQDPNDWYARYPEFAPQLREFVTGQQQLRDVVERAAAGLALAAADAPTLLGHAAQRGPSGAAAMHLRYFGDYELVDEIARGGMGVVFRARQVSLNRPVAVKMILAGEFATPEDVSRFRAEAESAANLDHPGIVPIYEIGQCEGHHYFSMKFIEGESLAQRLKREGWQLSDGANGRQPPPIRQTELRSRVQLVADVAKAIHFAHQRGIIHRDLKPANILIDKEGLPHVTDFGLAKSLSTDSELTRTGAIVGTPSYMAPEQAGGGGKHVTTAADIYGLGAILYAVLTGRPPFEGATPLEILLQVRERPPVSPRLLCAAVDSDLEVICLKCLAKEADERYRSAGELADDLERWIKGEPIQAAPPSLTRLLRRWFSEHFRAAAMLLLLGFVIGCLVCEPAINVLAHNLSPFLSIYRGQFGQLDPPGVLIAISSYPRILGLVGLPLLVPCYFGMGWFADWLARPKDHAAAVISGAFLGSVAAVTAFLVAIGWQSLIQVAIWPSKADLELLAATIDGDSTFSDGRTLQDAFPGEQPQSNRARLVVKKIMADIQSRIPLGLGIGFLFSIGALLLPAACQTWLAFALRSRGDSRLWQFLHLVELSVPATITLVIWANLLWELPLIGIAVVGYPLLFVAAIQESRRWDQVARRSLLTGLAAMGLICTVYWIDPLFTTHWQRVPLAPVLAGTAAVACAVFQRWPWWARTAVYAVWLSTLFLAGARIGFFGAASTTDAASVAAEARTRLVVTFVGTVAVLSLTAAMVWRNEKRRTSGFPV
jgi:serine/threonine protein kinase